MEIKQTKNNFIKISRCCFNLKKLNKQKMKKKLFIIATKFIFYKNCTTFIFNKYKNITEFH